jgi:hypothetical protein
VARGAVSEINLSDEDRAAVRARLENLRVAVVQVLFGFRFDLPCDPPVAFCCLE